MTGAPILFCDESPVGRAGGTDFFLSNPEPLQFSRAAGAAVIHMYFPTIPAAKQGRKAGPGRS